MRIKLLISHWFTRFLASGDGFTTRHWLERKWAADYSSLTSDHYAAGSFTVTRAAFYLYMLIISGRCILFAYIAQTGKPMSLDAYRRWDPLLSITVAYLTQNYASAVLAASIFLFIIRLDYIMNVRLFPCAILRPIHELLVLNSRFRYLPSFPGLSPGVRSRVKLLVLCFEIGEILFHLVAPTVCSVLIVFLQTLIHPAIINNSLTGFIVQSVLAFVESIAVAASVLNLLATGLQLGCCCIVWLFTVAFHLRECSRHRLQSFRRAFSSPTIRKPIQQLQICAGIERFIRREHAPLITQLILMNRWLISPGLFIYFGINTPTSIYLPALLIFLRPPTFLVFYSYFLLALEAGGFLLVVSFLLFTLDAFYRPLAALLYKAHCARTDTYTLTRVKIRLALYYERVHLKQRSPACFTLGTFSELTRKWFLEFTLLYTGFLMFVFKMAIKNSLHETL